jgi:hypothetical protein
MEVWTVVLIVYGVCGSLTAIILSLIDLFAPSNGYKEESRSEDSIGIAIMILWPVIVLLLVKELWDRYIQRIEDEDRRLNSEQ